MKTFTLEEAHSLLPVLESLLKRAIEGKKRADAIEESLQALNKKIFLSGGLLVDVAKVRRQRSLMEQHLQQAKDSLDEIDAIGVQVKDIDTGLLDFPCDVNGETVLLCWKMGESRIDFWHTMDSGFRGRQPIDEPFIAKIGKRPGRPN
jgi:hypothetical protein